MDVSLPSSTFMLHGFEARNFAQGARSFGGVSLDKLSLNGENGGLF
jgi:hypothetical protein